MAAAQLSLSQESRLDFLSRPKIDFSKFKDKKSVYWLDKFPSKTGGITVPTVTMRQEALSRPKKIYKNDRLTPARPVSQSALQAVPTPRVQQLAQAKTPSKQWKLDRPPQTVVSKGAMTVPPRPRTVELARPKKQSVPLMKQTETVDQSTGDGRSVTNLASAAFKKTEQLAVPKTEHPQYLHEKSVQWAVPASAKNHVPTDRVCQLAKHKMRKSLFEGYDPYRIPEGAKHAEASPRVQELSTPLPRKLRTKKV